MTAALPSSSWSDDTNIITNNAEFVLEVMLVPQLLRFVWNHRLVRQARNCWDSCGITAWCIEPEIVEIPVVSPPGSLSKKEVSGITAWCIEQVSCWDSGGIVAWCVEKVSMWHHRLERWTSRQLYLWRLYDWKMDIKGQIPRISSSSYHNSHHLSHKPQKNNIYTKLWFFFPTIRFLCPDLVGWISHCLQETHNTSEHYIKQVYITQLSDHKKRTKAEKERDEKLHAPQNQEAQ